MKSRAFSILVLVVLVAVSACADLPQATETASVPTFANSQALHTLECQSDSACAAYLACVSGGTVRCFNGHCAGFDNNLVFFDCVAAVANEEPQSGSAGAANQGAGGSAPPSVSCGSVTAPPEQLAVDPSDASCAFYSLPQQGEDSYRAWIQATADTPFSTLKVHELSSFCVVSNGLVTPLGGSAKGQSATTWSGVFNRSAWYHPNNKLGEAQTTSGAAWVVPTNPLLLHLGHAGSTAGCREVVVKLVFSTTGDAKVEVGLDYYKGSTWSREASVSGWKSCSSGTAVLSTPSSDQLNCSNGFESVCSPVPETCNGKDDDCDGAVDEDGVCVAPPPANACPSSGIKLTPGAALLAACPGLVLKTWGVGGTEFQSQPGGPLTVSDTWSGYAYVAGVCNGVEKTWTLGQTNKQAGFESVCVQGTEVSDSTYVCWDVYSHVNRPTVPLSVAALGGCPG